MVTDEKLVKETLDGNREAYRDFAQYMQKLSDVNYPQAERIILVMNNLNTHTPSALYEAFEPAEAKRILDRFEIHYTLNMEVGLTWPR